MTSKGYTFVALTFTLSLLLVASASNSSDSTSATTAGHTSETTPGKSTPHPGSTTTLTPEQECAKFNNKTCKECVEAPGYKCFFCFTDKKCRLYPASKVLPTALCSLSEARWGVCWVNFEALIIAMSVIGGLILMTITCCCVYCCCCRGGNKKKYAKEDAKWERQKTERKQRSDDRKADRKERMDEIRRKYGLIRDEPYQRFDA